MTQQTDGPRNASRRTGGIVSAEREVSPPVVGPGRMEMPTHPEMPRLQSVSGLRTGRLRFAPAPTDNTVPTEEAALPADLPADSAPRTDWIERAFEAGWVGLLAACAMEVAWRLL